MEEVEVMLQEDFVAEVMYELNLVGNHVQRVMHSCCLQNDHDILIIKCLVGLVACVTAEYEIVGSNIRTGKLLSGLSVDDSYYMGLQNTTGEM